MKPSWFVPLVAGAVSLPYVLSNEKDGPLPDPPAEEAAADPLALPAPPGAAGTDPFALAQAASAGGPPLGDPRLAPGASPMLVPAAQQPPIAGYVLGLEDVLRFDVSTAWIIGRWQRVSTGLAELDLQGYRVPLVTGTGEADLAGSLTYYFNTRQQVDKLEFQGTTGDARRLVAFITAQHGLQRKYTGDAGLLLYQSYEQGQVLSDLRIKPARVVRAGSPLDRFEVLLVLRRPGTLRGAPVGSGPLSTLW